MDIYEVANGQATKIPYQTETFSFGDNVPPQPGVDLGFAGFRLHTPINRPDYHDEVCVFLGASYFRAVAKGELYGLSARGLSINTGQGKGEEFPFFKIFWIEKPAPNASSIVVHALLDSESAAAAYRFTIRPGDITVFDVEMALYPRIDLEHAGLAPMTSMFFFGPNDRIGVDDFRGSVHDSDGLAIFNGRGEELWRPLHNPKDLQISTFSDLNPHGFGLMQRQKEFSAYQDLESGFERRPSLWAEPIGDWGEGEVQLLEIPTREEVHDNIASFWHPKTPLQAKGEHTYTYRLHWGPDSPKAAALARFSRTGVGAKGEDSRIFVLDLVGEKLKSVDPKSVRGVVSAEKGQNSEYRHPAKSGDGRLASQLRNFKGEGPGRTPGIADAGQRCCLRGLGLSMDTLIRGPEVCTPDRHDQFLPAESPMPMSAQAFRDLPQRSRLRNARPSVALRRAYILAGTAALTLAWLLRQYDVLKVGWRYNT